MVTSHSGLSDFGETALVVKDLVTELKLKDRTVCAVRGVSLHINAGETLGVVGESGCGKSMTAFSIMGMVPSPGRVVSGSIRLGGQELQGLSERDWRRIRGKGIAIVFQNPLSSLNPIMTIGRQVAEVYVLHEGLGWNEAAEWAVGALESAGLPDARGRLHNYPHELSGGMRQRVMIAMALASSPRLLIADEPTTALDVTTEKRILDTVDSIKRDLNTAVLLISHDIGLVADRADRICVMYAGRVVESGPASQVVNSPAHPYTRALLDSVVSRATKPRSMLPTIAGSPPDLAQPISGCAFAPRCSRAEGRCWETVPGETAMDSSHTAACHFPLAPATAPERMS